MNHAYEAALAAQPLALFNTLVTSVRQDPLWWSALAVVVLVGLLALLVLLQLATHRRVVRLQRLARNYVEQDAHAAAEHLNAAHYYLRDLDEKLGSTLPRDVRVGSIKADNLVVQPSSLERFRQSR